MLRLYTSVIIHYFMESDKREEAKELLEARKQGVSLSQWRRETQAPPAKQSEEADK